MTRRVGGLVAAIVIVAGLVGSAELTLARFHDADTATAAFGTRTLQPPTGVAGSGGTGVSLTWTPSASGWAAGYELLRSAVSGSGYGAVATITPIFASTAADDPGDGTWYYVLRSTFHNWQSVRSNEAAVTVGQVTTPFADCASGQHAAVTVNAGDNNGYEGSPDRACARDGSPATDSATGTATTNSCTAPTKDRHDFWGYNLGLPVTVSSITGITVQPVVGESSNGGTTWVCVQLSWDAGVSWTAFQRVVLTGSALGAYTVGGPGDTWGHAWTPAEITGGLRVRVTDSSSHPNKQLRLDAIGVAVTYRP